MLTSRLALMPIALPHYSLPDHHQGFGSSSLGGLIRQYQQMFRITIHCVTRLLCAYSQNRARLRWFRLTCSAN